MTIQLESEVPLGSHKYRVGRMSVFEQMNVAADYRDVIIGLAIIKRDRPKGMNDEEYMKAVRFIMASPAGMLPETRERVVNSCLSKVTRHSGVGWAPVLAGSGVLQFDDISLPDMFTLVYAVLDHNKLLDFFSESPSSSGGQTKETGLHSHEAKTG